MQGCRSVNGRRCLHTPSTDRTPGMTRRAHTVQRVGELLDRSPKLQLVDGVGHVEPAIVTLQGLQWMIATLVPQCQGQSPLCLHASHAEPWDSAACKLQHGTG